MQRLNIYAHNLLEAGYFGIEAPEETMHLWGNQMSKLRGDAPFEFAMCMDYKAQQLDKATYCDASSTGLEAWFAKASKEALVIAREQWLAQPKRQTVREACQELADNVRSLADLAVGPVREGLLEVLALINSLLHKF